MNKQELAAKIWKTANELRGSMEASEYLIIQFAAGAEKKLDSFIQLTKS